MDTDSFSFSAHVSDDSHTQIFYILIYSIIIVKLSGKLLQCASF